MRSSSPTRWPAAMQDEQFDLILTGLQSDDQGFAQTGVDPRRAARPAARHDHHGSAGRRPATLRVKRELEGGWFQWVAMPLPAVLTIQSGINQLRYATLKGIMAAKKKEIRKVAAARRRDGRASRRSSASTCRRRPRRRSSFSGSPAEAAKELVRRLREDARVSIQS